MNRGIWAIIAVSSVLLFSGMYAYGVAGNTTVENLGVNQETGFIQIEVIDPDGISLARLCSDNPAERCFGFSSTCDPLITSEIIELPPVALPRTATVTDCDPPLDGDTTVWRINSGGEVICIQGSCLPGQSENRRPPGVPPVVPPGPP